MGSHLNVIASRIGLMPPFDNRLGDGYYYPNCGIVAASMVAYCKLDKAMSAYRDVFFQLNGRHLGKRWLGKTDPDPLLLTLEKLGVEFVEEAHPRCSLKNFCEQHSLANARYLVWTGGHAQVTRNNMVSDQRGPRMIDDYWGKRKIIKKAIRIISPNIFRK